MRWRRTTIGMALMLACLAGGSLAVGGEEDSAAERGRRLLTGRGFLGPAWTEGAYAGASKTWASPGPDPVTDPASYVSAFADRYGLHHAPYPNDGLPMGLRKAATKDGSRTGLQIDCLVCHGGSIGGTSYVGLGNSQLDLIEMFRDLTRADGRSIVPIPFTLNTTRGTVNAGQMSVFLLSLRNADLSRRFFPLATGANLPELDTPAWWVLSKKATKYYDGRTDARSARSNMQFLLGEKSLDEFKALEPAFDDIDAYLKSLKAPKYPFPIDESRAKRGELVFARTCARCHGTYGENPTYPNEMVPLDIIGTDPARAEGISDRFIAHYNASWFADIPVNEAMEGYQAPPLDGIWATAPYLHNGSVPTLGQLLKSDDRPARFLRPPSTGFEHYDTTRVGWKNEPFVGMMAPDAPAREAKRLLDSSRWGFSNQGHTFGDRLSEGERADVIEYLKTL